MAIDGWRRALVTHLIGLLLGTEDDWPTAFEQYLRRRVGLRSLVVLRQGEAELVAQVRQALGADRFEELFAAGARLSQQEAVAAVRDRRGAGAAAS